MMEINGDRNMLGLSSVLNCCTSWTLMPLNLYRHYFFLRAERDAVCKTLRSFRMRDGG
jgi:hypothetical protein